MCPHMMVLPPPGKFRLGGTSKRTAQRQAALENTRAANRERQQRSRARRKQASSATAARTRAASDAVLAEQAPQLLRKRIKAREGYQLIKRAREEC